MKFKFMNRHLTEERNIKTLNIDYHVKRLLLEALNSSQTIAEAAEKLGISARSAYRYMDRFDVRRKERYYPSRYYCKEQCKRS